MANENGKPETDSIGRMSVPPSEATPPAPPPAPPPPPPPPPRHPTSTRLSNIKTGDECTSLKCKYAKIILWTSTVVVFIDECDEVRMDTDESYGEYPQAVIAIWSQVKIAESRPLRNLNEKDRRTYLLLVAKALAEVAEKDGVADPAAAAQYAAARLESANRMMKAADEYRASRLAEVSRQWYLSYSSAWCLIWMLALLYIWLQRADLAPLFGQHVTTAANCVAFGVFGAFVSVCMRLGNVVASPESGHIIHHFEAVVRLIIGAAAAIAVYIAVQTGIILKDIATPDVQLLLIYLVAMVAGLSERALPTLAAQVPGGLAADLKAEPSAQRP